MDEEIKEDRTLLSHSMDESFKSFSFDPYVSGGGGEETKWSFQGLERLK